MAADSAQRIRARSGWMSFYLAAFAAGFAFITLVLGLIEPRTLRMISFAIVWPTIAIPMSRWAQSRPSRMRGSLRRSVPYWIATGALYGTVLVIGTPRHLGQASFWFPAAALVALPLSVGAYRERRA